jgi:hypothetical protein
VIGKKDVELEHLEEAYTTENWLVRIYRVLPPSNRPSIKYQQRQIKSKQSRSIATKVIVCMLFELTCHVSLQGKSKKGVIKAKPMVVKGKGGQQKGR